MRFKLALLALACVLLAVSYPYLSNINYNISRVETTTTQEDAILAKVGASIGKYGLWVEAKAKIKSSLILNDGREVELIDPFESYYYYLLSSYIFTPYVRVFNTTYNKAVSATGVYQRDGNYARYLYAYFGVPDVKNPTRVAYEAYSTTDFNVVSVVVSGSLPAGVLAFKLTEYGASFGGSYSNLLDLSASYVMLVGFSASTSNVRLVKPDNSYVNPSTVSVVYGDNDGNDCVIADVAYNCHVGFAVVITYSSDITLKEVQLYTSKDTSLPVTRLVFNSPVTLYANTPLVIYVDYYVQ